MQKFCLVFAELYDAYDVVDYVTTANTGVPAVTNM